MERKVIRFWGPGIYTGRDDMETLPSVRYRS
jgi:hypothetical protein